MNLDNALFWLQILSFFQLVVWLMVMFTTVRFFYYARHNGDNPLIRGLLWLCALLFLASVGQALNALTADSIHDAAPTYTGAFGSRVFVLIPAIIVYRMGRVIMKRQHT